MASTIGTIGRQVYKTTKEQEAPKSFTCPECGGERFRVNHKIVQCTNCGHTIKRGNNKYGAKRTVAADGIKRDSKYEASVADELFMRKQTGDILDYDSQYKVIMPIHREDGLFAFNVSHKVDFRLHHKDGSFELLEAKGVETSDYKWRRRLLEELWLPMHLDHTYTVVKQARRHR